MRNRFLLFFFLFVTKAFSQLESPFIQNFTNKVYGKNSNPEIYAVVQDNQNAIIAGTSNGVLVYNGQSWKFVGVKQGAYVIALSKTKSGRIILGSVGDFGELVKNQYGKYIYQSYCTKNKITESVWRVFAVDETTYFQTDKCIFVYKEGKFVKKILAQTSFHLSFEVDGKIYVRQREKGLFVLENNNLKLIDASSKMKSEGLFTFFNSNVGRKYFFRNDASTNPIEFSIYGGIRLSDGNFALNTLSDGIYILDQNFVIKRHYNQTTGLTDNDVKQIYQASDGNLWLATNNGLSYLEYNSDLSFYNENHGLQGDVNDAINFNNQTYFASSKGVFIKTNQGVEKLAVTSPSWEFLNLNSKLYVATAIGIFEISDKTVSLKKSGNYNNLVLFQNQIVLSGINGIELCHLNFKTKQNFEIPINRSLKMQFDPKRNELWIGTVGSGLFRLKKDLSLEIYDNAFDGLNVTWIKPFYQNNKMLFATKDGLQQFVYEEEVKKSLPDSLKNDPSYFRGIFEPYGNKTEISEMFSFKNKEYVVVSNEIKEKKGNKFYSTRYTFLDFGRINSIKRLSDGNVYLCTSDGVSVLENKNNIRLGSFVLTFDKIESKTKQLNILLNESLAYSENNLKFSLKAPLFFHSTKVKYRFKMAGEQDAWSAWSGNSSINFTKLFEGNYTLYIQAENSFGQKSNILKFSFVINAPWYRTIYAYLLYALILGFSFWFSIKISKQRLQRKNEELEGIVKERTHEIELQKEEIEEKHKEITDSINYAERIQNALMMSDEHWDGFTKDYFILFKPRDVVSGDFYWAYQNDDVAIWTAADCTGHGVPGAFMSMLGIGFLNEIVIEGKNFEPNQILNLLRSKIINSLQQKGSSEERKDGMDISLCCWDKKSNTIKFAGANNPLILITQNEEKALSLGDDKMLTNEGKFLITIGADKMPVGKYVNDEKSFSQKEFALDTGDVFFSFSDGFPDQFGGADGKKYMIKRFKNFLLEQNVESVSDYKLLLENEFQSWLKTGNAEQIDDICVVGVKIS